MKDLSKLARLDAMAQAELCASGEVSPADLWSECMERIAILNPLLRAVTTSASAPGVASPAGPLFGVPFLMKDSSPWPGLRWSLGARLFGTRVTQQQTEYGRRLEQAGLVCAGKTALSEFGLLASTETLLEGATLNPWNLACSPLGSSGGSAVAVAAGLVPLAHANDGGGSIRVPASACGLFGFKPSRGRTVVANRSGSEFANMTSDHCLSRSVRDSALFLSLTEDHSASAPVGFVRGPSTRRLRIAAWTTSMVGDEPDAAVLRAHERTILLLRELGHQVEPVSAPCYEVPGLGEAYHLIAGAAVAGVVESIDRTRGEPVQSAELEPFTWSLVDALGDCLGDPVAHSLAAFARAVSCYNEVARHFDLVLTPTVGMESVPLGYLSPILARETLLERTRRILAYTPIHNIAGCPAMSVPLQWSDAGLPIGAHFAAAPGEDARLLALAYELERAAPWQQRWPAYSIPMLGGSVLDDAATGT
ncbi:MAG TPA: amidase family protein [Polyangiaceae bacterium]|nr:amidase family protein [Polyangiaceae bacterium]